MEPKVVLVTGAHGFIGGRVVKRLADRGYRVRGLVRREGDLPKVETVRGDVTDRGAMQRVVEGVDAVVHCAAEFGSDFEQAKRVNVEGTRHLAEAALSQGCERFVHLSTCGVYDLVGREVVEEATPTWAWDPATHLVYGVTKAQAERELREVARDGLDVVILRPPNCLGPDELNSWSYHIALAAQDGRLEAAGAGSNTWPYVVIDNLLDAIDLALEHPGAAGETYTVVDGHTTWGEYAGIFASWLGTSLKTREPRAPYDFFTGRFSSEKIRRELGYEGAKTFDQVMQETRAFLVGRGVL